MRMFKYTTIAALHGRLSVLKMLRHWGITFFGNLAGKPHTPSRINTSAHSRTSRLSFRGLHNYRIWWTF